MGATSMSNLDTPSGMQLAGDTCILWMDVLHYVSNDGNSSNLS